MSYWKRLSDKPSIALGCQQEIVHSELLLIVELEIIIAVIYRCSTLLYLSICNFAYVLYNGFWGFQDIPISFCIKHY